MRTILLGLDAFDPVIFERLSEQGRMPNLGKYVKAGNYARFSVSNPPQSEVSWTSIATGADPGVHGMFDFVNRNPLTYSLSPSLLPTKTDVLGTQFVPPYSARTLFEQATINGYPASVLWWPATFPARLELPVQTIPGLGTPDIQGRLGVGAVYSPDRSLADPKLKTPVELLHEKGKGHYVGTLKGPSQKGRGGSKEIETEFQLELHGNNTGRLTFGKTALELTIGQWSPIFEVTFKAGFMVSIHAVTRVLLSRGSPEPRLYFLPLQIHPLHSPYRYATPPGFVKETWNGYGPFLTLGWPQDTTGLEEGWINDDQFIALCRSIDDTREKIFFHHLNKFREGVLANVFDTLDRLQHMLLQDRPDVVEAWYLRLDALVGQVEAILNSRNEKTRLLIMSDHGFTRFDYKVHLNRWLVENHYLALQNGGQVNDLSGADWSRSQAYAIGLNSLYVNLKDREGQGIVAPDEVESLRDQLRRDLLNWKGPDGRPVIQEVYLREDAFHGPLLPYAPDLLVGYSAGYRASAETGLGKWEQASLVSNTDHWHSDHCIDPQAVPGVLFANTSLMDYPQPSFRDIPSLAIGMDLDQSGASPRLPQRGEDEDQKTIEERLKGLGYL
jgi:predicted AlkP superfamily phosphohydrolase/phosphomutase